MSEITNDELSAKLAEARGELFKYDRMVETQMINGPEYVIDEMVAEIKKLRKALKFYAKESTYDDRSIADYAEFHKMPISEDCGDIAREALK